MRIAFVIATFNRSELVTKLLEQIRGLSRPDNTVITPIVVIDGSTDDTEKKIKQDYPETEVILGNGNWWWTKCMNVGFRRALELNQDYILIMNDDVELKQDYLSILLRDYSTLPAGSILGSISASIEKPHLVESSGTFKVKKLLFKFSSYHNGAEPLDPHKFHGIHATYTLSGRGTLIPASLFNRIGFYDENLVQYGSDDEFVYRAKLSGVPVFISWNAVVYVHFFMTSVGAAYRKDSATAFLKSFFSIHSVNSLRKAAYLYGKYSYKLLLPLYIPYFVLGAIYARLFKYK